MGTGRKGPLGAPGCSRPLLLAGLLLVLQVDGKTIKAQIWDTAGQVRTGARCATGSWATCNGACCWKLPSVLPPHVS